MTPAADTLSATVLVVSVAVQLGAAFVAMSQMRMVGRYRYAWLAISVALVLMVQRRAADIEDLLQGVADPFFSDVVGLLISLLMLIGVIGLRALFANMRSHEKELVRLATTDALTQAHNRRHALELARREITRQRRTGRPLALLVMDLDHFKAVNDTHGHAVGDTVLVGVCAVCKEALRAMDIFGRLGGEEFVVVLPETDEAQAIASSERLRARIATLATSAADATVHITVSIGIAISTGKVEDVDAALTQLLHQADAALYAAKEQGRDRCVVWHPEPASRKALASATPSQA